MISAAESDKKRYELAKEKKMDFYYTQYASKIDFVVMTFLLIITILLFVKGVFSTDIFIIKSYLGFGSIIGLILILVTLGDLLWLTKPMGDLK